MKPKVVFFQITKPIQKVLKIAKTAEVHFIEKIPLCILAPTEEAAKFIDEALWKEPLLSFLPHSIVDHTTEELVFITTKKELASSVNHLFNLCQDPSFQTTLTYEFDDTTSPEKKTISEKKFKAYKEQGLILELHNYSEGIIS